MRAKISPRTLRTTFAGVEDGVVAVLQETLERISRLASRAFDNAACWQDGMRAALGSVLAFFDAQPALANVCLVQTLAGGPSVLERRTRLVAEFRDVIVARVESELPQVPSLVADSVLASVTGLVHAHLAIRQDQPLVDLTGPLMGVIVRPFATSEQAINEETQRGNELAQAIKAGLVNWRSPPTIAANRTPQEGLARPVRREDPDPQRPFQCLLFLAGNPNSSNRDIANGIGVNHQSQISRLLASLHQDGLIDKHSHGPGRPNAWSLNPDGERLARSLAKRLHR